MFTSYKIIPNRVKKKKTHKENLKKQEAKPNTLKSNFTLSKTLK